MTTTASISFSLDQETFEDIIETAGYCISYWASRLQVNDEACSVRPIDEAKVYVFSLAHMEQILAKAASGAWSHNQSLTASARSLVFEGDPCQIDGSDADSIVQLCCFDEIVYG